MRPNLGCFLSHPVTMPLVDPPAESLQTARVVKFKEKGSDVNIATYLLVDGFDNGYEVAVINSKDSDLPERARWCAKG